MKTRNELVDELQLANKAADDIRHKIDQIDYEANKKKREALLGKCFLVKSEPESDWDYGYFRVDDFDINCTGYAYGTGVQFKDYNHIIRGKKVQTVEIKINDSQFLSWIEHSKRVPLAKFNKALAKAKSMIK